MRVKPEFLSEAPVNTQGNLNVERIGAMGIPFPPFEEQKKIVAHCDSDTHSFDTVVSRTEREIILLREYRTTLTAEVVTGKLDVREAAKRLPAVAEEPLPADDLPDDIDDEAIEEPDK